LLPESFFIKVKVLGGGFSLWLGDNIAILSMVKREHLLFLIRLGADEVGCGRVCLHLPCMSVE
jgi:hypothetical protein